MRNASCLGHQSWSSTKHVYSAAMLYPFPHLRVKEEKPPLINQQSVVYEFKCDLCDTSYIAYTCRHLYQRGDEHEHSVIGRHYRDEYVLTPVDLIKNFKVLKKCRSKLDNPDKSATFSIRIQMWFVWYKLYWLHLPPPSSASWQTFRLQGQARLDTCRLIKNFKVLKKCRSKLKCLILKMLFVKNKRPNLNTQADSIRAKLFTKNLIYFLTPLSLTVTLNLFIRQWWHEVIKRSCTFRIKRAIGKGQFCKWGGYSSEFSVGVCRPVLEILTLFQTKTCHFPYVYTLSWFLWKPYLIPDHNGKSLYPSSDQNGSL